MKTKIIVILLLIISNVEIKSQEWMRRDVEIILPGTSVYSDRNLNSIKFVIGSTTKAIVFESDSTNYYGLKFKFEDSLNTGYVHKEDIPVQTIKLSGDQILAFYTPLLHSSYQFPTVLKLITKERIVQIGNFSSKMSYANIKFRSIPIDLNDNRSVEIIELSYHDMDSCSTSFFYKYYKYEKNRFEEIGEFIYDKDEFSSPTLIGQFPSDPFGKDDKIIVLKIDYIFRSSIPYNLEEKKFEIVKEIKI